jgi:hypothetical protein
LHIYLHQFCPLSDGLQHSILVLHKEDAPLRGFDLSQGVLQHPGILALVAQFDDVPSGIFHQLHLESPLLQQFLDQIPFAWGLEDETVAVFVIVISKLPKAFRIIKEVLEDPVAPGLDDGDALLRSDWQGVFWQGESSWK